MRMPLSVLVRFLLRHCDHLAVFSRLVETLLLRCHSSGGIETKRALAQYTMWAKFPGPGHHLLSADLRQMQEWCEEETAAMDREFQYSSTRGADWSCFRMVPG